MDTKTQDGDLKTTFLKKLANNAKKVFKINRKK